MSRIGILPGTKTQESITKLSGTITHRVLDAGVSIKTLVVQPEVHVSKPCLGSGA